MLSPTPTSGASVWPAFGQQQEPQHLDTEGKAQAPSFLPSNAPFPSQQMPDRSWGPTGLGGEALYNASGRRTANLTDPIGSRPGSRLDERGLATSPSPSPLGTQGTRAQSAFLNTNANAQLRPRASAAAAVAAAASSAAARSRAASPSNTSAAYFDLFPAGGGGFMSFGSSALKPSGSQRWENHNASGQTVSHTPMQEGVAADSRLPMRRTAGTPTLVVDAAEADILHAGSEEKQSTIDAWATGLDATELRSPSYDNMAASFSALMSKSSDGSSFGPTHSSTPPKPLRSNTDSSLLSNPVSWNTGQEKGAQVPFHHTNSMSAAGSTSSLFAQTSGLLSPSAAVGASNQMPSATGSTGSSSLSASQASLPQQPMASPPGSASGHPTGVAVGTIPSHTGQGVYPVNSPLMAEIEAQLRMSPLFNDVLERLGRHENSVREVYHTIQVLNRNMSLLLERTKHMPPQHLGHQNVRAMSAPQPLSPHGNVSDEVRALSAQLNMVSASVSQMVAKAGGQAPGPPMAFAAPQPHNPLAGLGLGQGNQQPGQGGLMATPHLGSMNAAPSKFANSQQMGPFPGGPPFVPGAGGPNPRFNPMLNQIDTSVRQPNLMGVGNERSSRLSPRPGVHSPNPNSRRWRDNPSTLTDGSIPTGAMQPPDPSVIVTKWEHLNLHPDLLHSILRYGLGPPNKIQQRALPFLLRGSDIIAQAPPTQERIASYIIPVLQLVLNITRGEAPLPPSMGVRGPMALVISTTVDQATQAQRMAMGLGAALGIRVHIAAAAGLDVAQDASALIQTQPQIVVGTPQKMMDLFNYLANKTKGAISLDDIRIAVLDEVDQLIARNLADHVSALLRILPPPRVVQGAQLPSTTTRNGARSPGVPASTSAGSLPSPAGNATLDQPLGGLNVTTTDRQTAIFSNTVPQDVLNFAQSIHLRESVRVLVRREGGGVSTQGGPLGQSSSQGALSSGAASSAIDRPALQGQPINALGASPANNHNDPLSDPVLSSLRGLRQYYLYVAVTAGATPTSASSNSQAAHANEMKLDVITDMLEDMEFGQAVVYTGSATTQEAVTYKLASKGIEALGLQRDMASTTRHQVLAKYRSGASLESKGGNLQAAGQAVVGAPGSVPGSNSNANAGNGRKKALVVHDFVVHPKDVQQVPLIIFYDLPRSVDEYKDKIAIAAAGGSNRTQPPRPSVCVNVVTGSGGPRGDIEMLRTLECHLGCKMAELPMNPGQIMNM